MNIHMVPGTKYRIVYRAEGQRYDREAVMVYLGCSGILDSLGFSARPAAGTQQLPRTWIRTYEEVPASTPAYLNRRATR